MGPHTLGVNYGIYTQDDPDVLKGTNRFATNLFELDTELASCEDIRLAMEIVL